MPDPAHDPTPSGPLADVRVLDLATVIAGPNCARYLADFGATCIKVERPGIGDSLRNMAWRDPSDGTGLWWKLVNRNKWTVALDLTEPADRAVLLDLAGEADVLVENFRPGTLERLGVGPETLLARNPRLVVTRVTGFGQTGPYRQRPGFATIAESMSGLAAITGTPDGPPLLPPIALTDEVTGLAAAFATMTALHHARVVGEGQVVDVTLIESLLQIMSPLVTLYGATGEMQQRMGAGLPYSVPRGTYQCADGLWVGVSASSDSVAARLMELLGVGGDARFASFAARVEHRLEIEAILAEWCATRSRPEVIAAFERAEAAVGPVMTMADIAADPHYRERQAIVAVDGTVMQGPLAKLSRTPARPPESSWSGRALDADGDLVRADGWGLPSRPAR